MRTVEHHLDLDPDRVGGRGWRAGAVGIVAVLLAGGGWLVVTGLAGPTPDHGAAAAADTADSDNTDDAGGSVGGLGGFPVTRDGALAAAVAGLGRLGEPSVLFDDARLELTAAELFVAGEVRPQVTAVAVARQGFARSGWEDTPPSRRSYYTAPVAARLTGWTGPTDGGSASASARVVVWSVTVVTMGDTGGAVFTTSTIDLEADVSGRWWIVGLDTVDGPTPQVAGTPSVPGTYRRFLRDLPALAPAVPMGAGVGS